jgi:hypothetical protein
MTFNASADIREINRYDFTIEADTKEEAETKLNAYLEKECPYPYGGDDENDVRCTDREPAMEMEEVKSITIK